VADQRNAYQQAIGVALNDAKSMLGKNEVPNRSEIQAYLKNGGQDLDPHKLAWCAAFVSSSLQQAGLPVPTQVVKDSAFGPGAYAPNYLTYGSAVAPKDIQAGDILVNNNGSHVGFAEGPIRQGPNGPEVQLLAGNQRDLSGQYAPGSYTNPLTGAVANRAQVGMVGESWVPLSQYSARRYQPTDGQNGASATSSQGTTINTTTNATPAATPSGAPANQDILNRLKSNIAGIESGGNYKILGPKLKSGDYAIGKYQVMASNVPEWTKAALGQSMTADQFRANPQAQEKVADYQLGNYLNQYGPAGAASMWFSGSPNIHSSAKDVLGTSVPSYITRATQGITDFTPGPGRSPTGAAPAVAATPGTSITSTAVPAGSGTILPGFSDQATSDKFAKSATDFSQAMGGGGGDQGQQGQQPQMPPMPQTPFGGRNVGPLGGQMVGAPMFDPRMAAASYGTLLNSIGNMQPPPANPTAAAPGAQPGAPPGAGYGPQGQQAGLMPTGLTAMQMQQLSPYALGMQQQNPYGTSMTSLGGY
jgi:hypothetical protein